MIRSALLCAALLCAASPAAAAIQLDQEAFTVVADGNLPVVARVGEIPAPESRPGPSTINAGVQTFTAGLNGTLSSLEFQAANYGPASHEGVLLMSLIDGDYEAGARSVVWQDSIWFGALAPHSVASQGVLSAFFDLSHADYKVTAGQRYSVRFDGTFFAPNQFAALIVGQGPRPGPTPPVFSGPNYAGGKFIGIINGEPTSSISDFDIGFRSYVDVTAVPEPATWATLILGFGLLGATARHRRARRRSAA